MKRFVILATCMFTFGASFAQKKEQYDPAKAQRLLIASGKCALTGSFTDARNHPIPGVQAFIYGKDSSIAASGYSDSVGHYETNSVFKGVYYVKLVYPGAKTILVTDVTLKPGFNPMNVKSNAPMADTTIPAITFMPAPVVKKKATQKP